MTPLEKSRENPKSTTAAIRAMCFDCMGQEPTWYKEAKSCTAPQCPLHPFRPGANKQRPEAKPASLHKHVLGEPPASRSLAAKLKCRECMGDEPGWKTLVSECASETCPLWNYRKSWCK